MYVDYSQEEAVKAITALVEGEDAEILTECITCMACNEYCQKGAHPYDLICRLQEEKGIVLVSDETLTMIENTLSSVPHKVSEGEPHKSKMFDGLTVVKGGDYFSRIVYLHTGMESVVRENAQRFVDNLARLGKDEVILLHDDCYTLLAKKVYEYGIKVPFKPIHIVEFMVNYLKAHRREIIKLDRKIAYQRPCISRYTPEKEPMLDELFELIGVERVVRRYDREDALCCGIGLSKVDPERCMRIVDMNLSDVKTHGAEAMVFLCPSCYYFLSRPCEERGVASIFITDLCRMTLGEVPFSSRPPLTSKYLS
ncbi:hypothetical protein AC481_06015 [miscellaneous Crenarchaeota group archaeon SMTZ-80]|nr:MAG: hypothetical protein AC481_06015 [miscellaneous Crenarchaeota group archaeon SMTZ-80]